MAIYFTNQDPTIQKQTEEFDDNESDIRFYSFERSKSHEQIILMRHQETFYHLRNKYIVGLIINIITFNGVIFTVCDLDWLTLQDYNYGLLYYKNKIEDNFHLCNFGKNMTEQGGITTFFILVFGLLLHFILIIQNVLLIQNVRRKLAKFKTLKHFTSMFYFGGLGYWVFVAFLGNVVEDIDYFSYLGRDFYICFSSTVTFQLICFYFTWLKRKLKKNELVDQLLHHNDFIEQQQEKIKEKKEKQKKKQKPNFQSQL